MLLTLPNADQFIYLLRMERRRLFAETGSDCHLETLIREVGHFVAPLLIIHIAIINVINVTSKKR